MTSKGSDNLLNIISVNCRGLGNQLKRRDILHFLRRRAASVYFLQDTHFSPNLEECVKAEWGYKAFFSSYTSNSRGVAILFNNNFEFDIKAIYRCNLGNYIMVHIKTMDRDLLLVSIYGPNKDDPEFYNNLENCIKKTKVEEIIIGGDWNLVMDFNLDTLNYKHLNNEKARERVLEMTENLELADIWRELNLDTKRYTWRRTSPTQQSRLDFFLLSNSLSSYVTNVDIMPGYKTDHSIITVNLQFGPLSKRNSFWKFNSSLLKDKEYGDMVNDTINNIMQEYASTSCVNEEDTNKATTENQFTVSDQVFLDFLLMKIRQNTISYAASKKRKENEREINLINNIKNLEQKSNMTTEENEQLHEHKTQLEKIREKKMEGVLIRSRAQWLAEGEKITKYFCNLEKRNYVSKNMNRLIKNDGTVITDSDNIMQEVVYFYQSLYEKKTVEEVDINDLVHNKLKYLSKIESDSLEGLITLEEAGRALKNMKNFKSPGTDGFTVEFFKFFWLKLGPLVVRSLNDSFIKGELTSTQKQGIIVCLPKGNKPKEYIKNWRPITLLNVVYKIGSACIANRIKPFLPSLIDEDQTGFINGRFLGDNIRLIYDIIHFLNENKLPGLLLCLDFEKAFDSLDWEFMKKVLVAFGMGKDFLKWVDVFYNNINTYISLNGNISQNIQIKRGCRQGDPISPYLFILCTEVLAIMIRENKNIKGIIINETEYKISQYADDTELLQNGDRQTFEETIKTIDKFSKFSGLYLNVEKTNAIWLGNKRNSITKYMQHLSIIWNPDTFKILGVLFNNDLYKLTEINTKEKIDEVKLLYLTWLKRQITPLGRIAILKSLILSKLVHLWMFLPNPPIEEINMIQKSIYEFIWNYKNDRISRKISNKNMLQGGLGIPDIKLYINSLKLIWIKKVLYTSAKWKHIIMSSLPFTQILDKLGHNLPIKHTKINNFWTDVFQAYKIFSSKCINKTNSEILAEKIYYNDKFTIGKNTFFYKEWFDKGIFCIGHFINNDGTFMSYNIFKEKYNVTVNFLTYAGCIEIFKKYITHFDVTLTDNVFQEHSRNWNLINNTKKGARVFYDTLIQSDSKPNCCDKWQEKFDRTFNWKYIFRKAKKISDVKLKWLQIRILHRIIGTNIILSKMGIAGSDLCSLCQKTKENIQHLFWSCEHSQVFWKKIEEELNKFPHTKNVKLTEYIVLFGHDDNFKTDPAFDFIIMLAKSFIYRCKYSSTIPEYKSFKVLLIHRCKIEKYAASLIMNTTQHNSIWSPYIDFMKE